MFKLYTMGYTITMIKPVLFTNFFEQKRTIDSLLKESRAGSTFYLFLSLSSFIITLGLLINNAVIIIGGMLVAPLLFPILSLGMGIATSSRGAIKRALGIITKSACIVFAVAFVTAFLLNAREVTGQMELASSFNLIFFLTAFASGIIAAFAWVKENISSTLPGIAVTVSLIPPLAVSGIAASIFSRDLFSGSLTLFLINLLGIVVASTIVFALFGFPALQGVEEREIHEEAARAEKERRQKEEADAAEWRNRHRA